MTNSRNPLARLARLASELGDDVVAREAVALCEQIERRELNILVVGQFKRGKSSIVNALLGEDLMPTGALPLTSIPTAIRYGEKPSVTVHLHDGVTHPASPDELAVYVSERRNPANALGVERVDIVRPAPALRDIALFDTPGVGSIHRHNTAAARSVLPRADAAILVVGPEPPIGAEELAYARDVAESSVQLFALFNKADIAGDALAEVLDFTHEALTDVAGGEFALFSLSALRARAQQREGREDPAFATFVRALREFVDSHGARAREESAHRRAQAFVERSAALLRMRAEAIALPQAERRHRRQRVEVALQALDDRVRFLDLVVDDDVRRLRLQLEAELDRRHDREEPEFRAAAQNIAAERSRAHRRNLLESAVRDRAHLWRHDAVQQTQRSLTEFAMKYVRLLEELEEAVIKAGCEALQIDAGALVPREITFAPAKLTLPVSIDPSTGLEVVRDFLTDIFPYRVRERILQHRIERTLSAELDALRGKLRYGIAHDLEPWRRSVHATISTSLEATRQVVLRAFPDISQSDDEEKAKDALHVMQTELAALRSSLEGMRLAC